MIQRRVMRIGNHCGFIFGTGAIYGFIAEYNCAEEKNAVWAEIARIPYGETISYAQLAERIDALVLLVPFCGMSPRGQTIARFHRVVSLFKPHLRSRSDSSILDPMARRNALGRGIATPRLLHELLLVVRRARKSAGHVRVPTLIIHSRRDPRISI